MAYVVPDRYVYDFERGGIRVLIDIDGTQVKALITQEALQDAARDSAMDEETLIEHATTFSPSIAEAVARKVATDGTPTDGIVVIKTQDLN